MTCWKTGTEMEDHLKMLRKEIDFGNTNWIKYSLEHLGSDIRDRLVG